LSLGLLQNSKKQDWILFEFIWHRTFQEHKVSFVFFYVDSTRSFPIESAWNSRICHLKSSIFFRLEKISLGKLNFSSQKDFLLKIFKPFWMFCLIRNLHLSRHLVQWGKNINLPLHFSIKEEDHSVKNFKHYFLIFALWKTLQTGFHFWKIQILYLKSFPTSIFFRKKTVMGMKHREVRQSEVLFISQDKNCLNSKYFYLKELKKVLIKIVSKNILQNEVKLSASFPSLWFLPNQVNKWGVLEAPFLLRITVCLENWALFSKRKISTSPFLSSKYQRAEDESLYWAF